MKLISGSCVRYGEGSGNLLACHTQQVPLDHDIAIFRGKRVKQFLDFHPGWIVERDVRHVLFSQGNLKTSSSPPVNYNIFKYFIQPGALFVVGEAA